MAFAHIYFSQSTQYGAKLRQLLNLLEQSDDLFTDVRDAEVAKRFAFGDYDPSVGGAPSALALSKAKAAFDELESAYSKTSGNGSVSNVRAARDQFLAKLRG
jgi:hypothetical protein